MMIFDLVDGLPEVLDNHPHPGSVEGNRDDRLPSCKCVFEGDFVFN